MNPNELQPEEHQELVRGSARDLMDGCDERLELELEDHHVDALDPSRDRVADRSARPQCFSELARPQGELVKWQDWVTPPRSTRWWRVFEVRDAAGKGGVVKRLTSA